MWNRLKDTVDGIVADLRDLLRSQSIPFWAGDLFETVDTLEWIMQNEPHNRVARQAAIVTLADSVTVFNGIVHHAKSAGHTDLAGRIAVATCELLTDYLHYAKKSGFADYPVHA
jgi:hypothetical protein